MFKFIHGADLHLDSPMVGLERYEGAPAKRIRHATRKALENLVDLAIENQVRFVLIAGDIYDGDWKDFNTGLFFSTQMARLRREGIDVYLVAGNHDAKSKITKKLIPPENVHMLSVDRPETVLIEDLKVAICGQGFAHQKTTNNLAANFPEGRKGFFNIGMLHTSADGREGHDTYAPCSPDELAAKGYNYWALGHVHTREVISKNPWIIFSGNTQGRSVRETGPKGCSLVTVEDGAVTDVSHYDLDVVRWEVCRVDAAGTQDQEEIVHLAMGELASAVVRAEERLVAARLVITGATKAHGKLLSHPENLIGQLRLAATDRFDDTVWIEKIKIKTTSLADLEEMIARGDPLSGLLKTVTQIRSDDDFTKELRTQLGLIRRKLPAGFLDFDDALDLENPERLAEILEDVKQILIPMLLAKGDRP